MKKFLIGIMFVFAAIGASSVIQTILTNNPNNSWLSNPTLVDQVINESLDPGDEVRSDVLNAKFNALNKKLNDASQDWSLPFTRDFSNDSGYNQYEQASTAVFSNGAVIISKNSNLGSGSSSSSSSSSSGPNEPEFFYQMSVLVDGSNVDGDPALLDLSSGSSYTVRMHVEVPLVSESGVCLQVSTVCGNNWVSGGTGSCINYDAQKEPFYTLELPLHPSNCGGAGLSAVRIHYDAFHDGPDSKLYKVEIY